jgi:hypothetical protein
MHEKAPYVAVLMCSHFLFIIASKKKKKISDDYLLIINGTGRQRPNIFIYKRFFLPLLSIIYKYAQLKK